MLCGSSGNRGDVSLSYKLITEGDAKKVGSLHSLAGVGVGDDCRKYGALRPEVHHGFGSVSASLAGRRRPRAGSEGEG